MNYHSTNLRYRRALIAVGVIQAVACRPQAEWSSIELHLGAFNRIELEMQHLPEKEKIGIIERAYDQLIELVRGDNELEAINDRDLEALYHATQLTVSYTHAQKHAQNMILFMNRLEKRGLASKVNYVQTYEAFIGARMLAEAHALARYYPMPEQEALPDLHEAIDVTAGHPTEWLVNLNERELLRRNVDLHQPFQVIIVSHPLCHFSRAAMHDIQMDPVLGQIFGMHAKWLAPQGDHINFDIVQQWNRQHPEQAVVLAFRREEWPMIDSWDTPTFYFLKDGAVAAKVEGWPREGRRSELIATLRQIGILQ